MFVFGTKEASFDGTQPQLGLGYSGVLIMFLNLRNVFLEFSRPLHSSCSSAASVQSEVSLESGKTGLKVKISVKV